MKELFKKLFKNRDVLIDRGIKYGLPLMALFFLGGMVYYLVFVPNDRQGTWLICLFAAGGMVALIKVRKLAGGE